MDVAKIVAAVAVGALGYRFLAPHESVDKNAHSRGLTSHKKEDAEDEDDEDSEMDEDSLKWEPHKMVLVVRNDLKMGKGKIAAQCGHATLGAYKRAVKRTPQALECWEALGQAKVALKVETEADMLELAARAKELGLVHYVVVDAGRTQIAPDTKTVLAVGPAPNGDIDNLTGHLKLM
ncbi:peptidyl-tRNA hydrolase [Thraustotheca clavata]|uniref:peptidyl-tRNA hydrolase n=1 Tax=Thraustotheca clavata TaxID=74557 RepID=A0A1W0A3J4_9STRA|nr:peptidyl-tRNA hydrolase [Thraustotheca clavata]